MTFDDLLKHVLPSVKGCPDALAVHHLRQATIEFCEGTLVWAAWLDGVPSVAGRDEYDIDIPHGTRVVKIVEFKSNGEEADVTTPGKGRAMALHNSGAEVAWTDNRITFRVSPAPIEAGLVYELRAALRPTQDAEEVDDELAEHYAQHLADGALAALMEIEGAPWENQQRALMRRDRFNDAIANIGARTAKGFGSGRRRSKALWC